MDLSKRKILSFLIQNSNDLSINLIKFDLNTSRNESLIRRINFYHSSKTLQIRNYNMFDSYVLKVLPERIWSANFQVYSEDESNIAIFRAISWPFWAIAKIAQLIFMHEIMDQSWILFIILVYNDFVILAQPRRKLWHQSMVESSLASRLT